MLKPLTIDLEYPSLDEIEIDLYTARKIVPAYSGLQGELTSTLQYVYQYFQFTKQGIEETAKVIMGIALAEMEHLKLLGNALNKLGLDPVWSQIPPYKCNFYDTSKISYSNDVQRMLLDDISAEMLAISEYKKMANALKNQTISALLIRISLDEELHVKVLTDCLNDYYTFKNEKRKGEIV